MKKTFIIFAVFILLIFAFIGCSKNVEDEVDNSIVTSDNIESTSDLTESVVTDISESVVTDISENENTTKSPEKLPETSSSNNNSHNNITEVPTTSDKNNTNNNNSNSGNGNNNENSGGNSNYQSNPFLSDEEMSKIENSQAEVFFSDNPNNRYICAVADKYGVDKSNLIALIKVNATFPSALVLEFNGNRNANGELIMTYSELKYVYNIDEVKGTLVRAGKNGKGNDGVNFVESKMLFLMMEEYFIPELPNLKANKRYPE